MPGLTLERELMLLKQKIKNLHNFLSDFKCQKPEDLISLRSLTVEFYELVEFKFQLEEQIRIKDLYESS